VQKQAAKFATRTDESVRGTLVPRRNIARVWVYSKCTPENGHGRQLGTGYKDHAT